MTGFTQRVRDALNDLTRGSPPAGVATEIRKVTLSGVVQDGCDGKWCLGRSARCLGAVIMGCS